MLSQLFKFLLVAARTPQSTTDNLRHGRALPYDTFYLRYPSYRSITNYGCPVRITYIYSSLADRTVHPYASVCTSVRLHCSFQSAETKKSKRRKKRGGEKGKDENRDSIVKERRSYVDLILLYLRGITGVRSRYLWKFPTALSRAPNTPINNIRSNSVVMRLHTVCSPGDLNE